MEALQKIGTKETCTAAWIIRGERVLLGLRNYSSDKWKTVSVWTTPGGRCNDGETVEDALRRETFEEVGIHDLHIESYVGEFGGAKEGDHLFVFLCSTQQEATLKEPEKFSEWRWFTSEEIPENFINPSTLPALRNLLFRSKKTQG